MAEPIRIPVDDGGWWPPGEAEPDDEWTYERVELALQCDSENVDVLMVTPDGDRGLCSIPLLALAELFAARVREREGG